MTTENVKFTQVNWSISSDDWNEAMIVVDEAQTRKCPICNNHVAESEAQAHWMTHSLNDRIHAIDCIKIQQLVNKLLTP